MARNEVNMIRPNPDINPIDNEPIDEDEFIEPEYDPNEFSHIHSDEELEIVLKELLHNSTRLDASDITVTVNHHDIKLSGSVKSQKERDAAGEIMKLVHGSGEIHNEIVVKLNEGILPTDIGRNP